MTTYKEIFGKQVKNFSSDPPGQQVEGQIWFNTTSGTFKSLLASGAWSSISPLSTARSDSGGSGIQTAAAVFGGRSTGVPNHTATEEYNGSGFNTGGAMNTGRQALTGFGTQTASVGTGGYIDGSGAQSLVEEYNGSSWSEVTNMPTTTFGQGSAGTLTSGLVAGGRTPSWVTTTFEYDGTNWTTGGAMGTARTFKSGMTGTQTAAVGFGGDLNPPSGRTDKVEEYNGSSWTEVNALPAVTNANMASGIQTSALTFGGNTPAAVPGTTNAFTYDGTNFTATGAMGTAINNGGTLGTASSNSTGLQMGGYGTSTYTNVSQEYNFSTTVTTPGAWSSGGTMPYSAGSKNGSGILTAAFVAGGETPPGTMVNTTTEYDGSSWSGGGVINSARADVMAAGTLTAGLIMGGFQNVPDPNFLFDETEEYNGTSWSEVNNMPTGAYSGSGTGTQTAAFVNNMYIGSPGERTNVTYEYDGTNWSSGGNTAETTNSRSSVGTLTAGLTVGGRPAPATYIDKTELYNGTSWTSGVDMVSEFQAGGQSSKGTQSDCIIFGSPRSPVNTDAFKTDGTTWFTSPSMASNQNNGTGTSTAALAFGYSDISQEFTGETTAANVETLTTS